MSCQGRRLKAETNYQEDKNFNGKCYEAIITYFTAQFPQDYETDTYLRQQWWDSRLAHPNLTSALDLADPRLVKAIWKPEVSGISIIDENVILEEFAFWFLELMNMCIIHFSKLW